MYAPRRPLSTNPIQALKLQLGKPQGRKLLKLAASQLGISAPRSAKFHQCCKERTPTHTMLDALKIASFYCKKFHRSMKYLEATTMNGTNIPRVKLENWPKLEERR